MNVTQIEIVEGAKMGYPNEGSGPDEVPTWWIRLRYGNGEICASTEPYTTKAHAIEVSNMFCKAFPNARVEHVEHKYG